MIGLPPTPDHGRAHGAGGRSRRQVTSRHPAPAAKLSSYVGVYANPYFGSAEIADVSGHLELKIGLSHAIHADALGRRCVFG
jgi:hypothetical protein